MAKSGLPHQKERRILKPYVVCLRRPEKVENAIRHNIVDRGEKS
jgi:hypothetical protein